MQHKSKLTRSGYMCLSDVLQTIGQFPDVSDRLLGQMYPPNQQCVLRYGQWSFDCRLGNSTDICTSLWCYNPSDELCYSLPPLTGTSCGSGKVCRLGVCVTDDKAPEVDDMCMYEDSMMVFMKSCPEGIEEFKGYCYNERVAKRCCIACSHVRANSSAECPFADVWMNCTSEDCVNGSMDDMSRCCHTCNNVTTHTLRTTRASIVSAVTVKASTGVNKYDDTTKRTEVTSQTEDYYDNEVSRSAHIPEVRLVVVLGLVVHVLANLTQ